MKMVITSVGFASRKVLISAKVALTGLCKKLRPSEKIIQEFEASGYVQKQITGSSGSCKQELILISGRKMNWSLTKAVKSRQTPLTEWQSHTSPWKSYMSNINPLTPFCHKVKRKNLEQSLGTRFKNIRLLPGKEFHCTFSQFAWTHIIPMEHDSDFPSGEQYNIDLDIRTWKSYKSCQEQIKR